MPEQGKMMVNALVPLLDRQIFGLGIPETIGSREDMMLVNHTDVEVLWDINETEGIVSTTWTEEGHMQYIIELIPAEDYVDLVITIKNLGKSTWHNVFAFNCVSPARAPTFRDSTHARTYLSADNQPVSLDKLPKVQGPRPTISVYPTKKPDTPIFAQAFEATSPMQSDRSWLVVISENDDAYMATVTADAAFLFTNTKFGCIHTAPSFEDLAPNEDRTVESRIYFSKGTMRDFLERYEQYKIASFSAR